MKLYKQYLDLKNKNKDTCYVFKVGIFYILLGEDCDKYRSMLGLKRVIFNDEIYKCGFPIGSKDKYIKILKENKVKYKIIDREEIIKEKNNEVEKILNKIKSVNIDTLTGLEALKLISQLKKNL